MKSILIRYILALLVVLFLSYFALILVPLTIYSIYFILEIFIEPTLVESTIIIKNISFTIIPACTALLAYVLLIEFILLTQGILIKDSIKYFLIGSIMIFIMNLLRILILIFIYLNLGKNYFDAAHLILWHLVSTIFVALIWIFLVEKYKIKSIPIYSDIKSI